ncbi:MAG TPA: Glu/Leu/Phe/Val dehydrogenase dimerization domain-containing protein [Streptosporangiaceae bacterium]|nr:Glu/Leu/Phe/Val dehydrogenase dimerization domain-containing protein [Streptosporangiaceae bacterium]
MAEQARDGRRPHEPETIRLQSVPGFIVFDLPGARTSAGGTRLAKDVTAAEVALLARAMTYKYAAVGARTGGAKAGVVGDPGDRTDRAARMSRYCEEIRPLCDSGRFLTGPDMGTFEEDFAALREHRAVPGAISAVVDGVPFEDLLTGYGVAVAAETALRATAGGGWDGRSAAIEGFGKVGGGVAREVMRRGGHVVAISTIAGSVADPSGLDIERLLELRNSYGDDCVAHYGRPIDPPAGLFGTDADVVVPGARPGVISSRLAQSLPAAVRVVAPAANAPYTARGAGVLRGRGIAALPDFVCNAGAVLGYRAAPEDTPAQVLAAAGDRITEIISLVLSHPSGPLTGACEHAGTFLRTWWGEPPAPPFAS